MRRHPFPSHVGQPIVSTLIRPHSRMRLSQTSGRHRRNRCFNPHPTSQPDATPLTDQQKQNLLVSTLIRPHSRMRRHPLPSHVGQSVVSTLIRPHSRMRLSQEQQQIEDTMFQPSSDLTAGCDDRPNPGQYRTWSSFNPHPTSQPDATPS